MKKITVDKKTVFFSNARPVIIFDDRGVFYDTSILKNFDGFFSLPAGNYHTDNPLIETGLMINEPKFRLPTFERNLKHNFDEFDLMFSPNGNKASIFHDKKMMVFDPSFKKMPTYVLEFVYQHEKGHNYYSTEWKADLYAIYQMLKKGYNLSQIMLSPFTADLSDRERINKIVTTAQNNS